jgi:hypothetical protein
VVSKHRHLYRLPVRKQRQRSDQGVYSIHPNERRYQMDCCEEISSGFIIACRDSAESLEVAEEVLNEVTGLESRFVIGALVFAIASRGNHGSFSRCAKRVDHTLIGVVCFVCNRV